MPRDAARQRKIDQIRAAARTRREEYNLLIHNSPIKDLPHTHACAVNAAKIAAMEQEVQQWPLRMDVIQFYAEMFEQSNRYYNDLVHAVNAMSDLMKDHHVALITLLKRVGTNTELLEQYEPLDFLPLPYKPVNGDTNV